MNDNDPTPEIIGGLLAIPIALALCLAFEAATAPDYKPIERELRHIELRHLEQRIERLERERRGW